MTQQNQPQAAHRLLDHMYAELVAARSLFMDGFLGQASLHMVSAWHALACLHAEQRGEPYPELSDFDIDPDALPNGAQLKRRAKLWSESMEAVRLFSPTLASAEWIERHTDLQTAKRARRKQYMTLLRFQLKAAEDVYQKLAWQRRRDRFKATLGGHKKVAALALTAAALLGLGIFLLTRPEELPVPDNNAPPPLAVELKRVKLAAVNKPFKEGTAFDAKGTVHFSEAVAVDLGKVSKSPQVEVSLDNNDDYRVAFVRGQVELASVVVKRDNSITGLRLAKITVPEAALSGGYDEVRIHFMDGDGIRVLGHLVLK